MQTVEQKVTLHKDVRTSSPEKFPRHLDDTSPSKYPPQQRHRCLVCQYIHKSGAKGTLVHEYWTSDERLCVLCCVYEYRNPKAI